MPHDAALLGNRHRGHGVRSARRLAAFHALIARDAALFLHPVVIGLKVRVADGPVPGPAIETLHPKIVCVQARPNPIVVHAGAAHAVARVKAVPHRILAGLEHRGDGPLEPTRPEHGTHQVLVFPGRAGFKNRHAFARLGEARGKVAARRPRAHDHRIDLFRGKRSQLGSPHSLGGVMCAA